MQTAKVVVVAVDRERKQLRFSEKEAEGEGRELAQKKAQLMVSSHRAPSVCFETCFSINVTIIHKSCFSCESAYV